MVANIWRRAVESVPVALLLLFMVSFYMPISAKASNNIFYAGLGLPALIWWVWRPRLVLHVFRAAPAVFACLALLTLVLGLKDPDFLKHGGYVFTLFLACVMLEQTEGSVRRSFFCFAVVGVILLGVSASEWLQVLRIGGAAPRVSLWGRTENPIFAALMIISGLVFLWLFYAEPRLLRCSSRARWLGFFVLTALCVGCGVVFQARSALLGFAFFAFGYAVMRRQFLAVVLVLGAALTVLALFGGFAPLLERGLSHRLDIWSAVVLRVVGECGVLLGCGNDEHLFLGEFYHAHSGYLSFLYYGGVVALSLFAAFMLAFFAQTWRTSSSWMLVALVGWGGLVTETSGVITSPRTLWVFFWIPVFMALIETGRPALSTYYRLRAAEVTCRV